MKKIISFFTISLFIVCLSFNTNSYAAHNSSNYATIVIIQSIYNDKYTALASTANSVTFYDTTYGGKSVVNNSSSMQILNYYGSDQWFNTVEEVINAVNDTSYDYEFYGFGTYANTPFLVVLKGNISYSGSNKNVFDSLEDYEESLQPTWWKKLGNYWENFLDYFDWWLNGGIYTDIWNWMFDEPDANGLAEPNFNVPTLTPSPTPIPYSTSIVPVKDPVTGDIISYEYNYHYYDNNGNSITATAPPPTPEGTGGNGIPSSNNGSNDPFALPTGSFIDFNYSVAGGSTISTLSALKQGLDIVDTVSEEYDSSISSVSDSFVVLPDKWFILLGCAAGIILICGIIGRLLG